LRRRRAGLDAPNDGMRLKHAPNDEIKLKQSSDSVI
jgi:hypothetical protein